MPQEISVSTAPFDDSGMTLVIAEAYRRVMAQNTHLPPLKAIRVNPNLRAAKLDGQYLGNGIIEINPDVTDPMQLERLLLHELGHAGGMDESGANKAADTWRPPKSPQLYEVEKNGKIYVVEAPSPQAAAQALERMGPPVSPEVAPPATRPTREQLLRMSPRDLRASGIDPKALPALISERETARTGPGVELLTGAAKRIAEMGVRGGAVLRKIPGVNRLAEALPSVDVPLTRSTPAERMGATVADLATITRMGGLTSALTKGMALPARMAAEAASMAGVAEAQGANPAVAGAVSAVIPAVAASTRLLPQALRDQAAKKVAQALGATKERFKAIATKRAPEILARGLRGSRAQLLDDAKAHARSAGQAIDDVLKEAGDQLGPTAPVVEALEEAKRAFLTTRTFSLAQAKKEGVLRRPGVRVIEAAPASMQPEVLSITWRPVPKRPWAVLTPDGRALKTFETAEKANAFAAASTGRIPGMAKSAAKARVEVPVVIDAKPIKQLSKLQQTIRELGDDASVDQLVAVRRVWDDVVARAGGFAHRAGATFGVPLAEQTEAWAKREATKAIRKALAAQVPDLAKVNQEFAFWKDLKDVLTATQARTQAQKAGIVSAVASIVGAGAGFSSGQTLEDRAKFALYGAAGGQVYRLLTSAPWRLVDARLRNALADALVSGSPGRMMSAATRIAAIKGTSLQGTNDETESTR